MYRRHIECGRVRVIQWNQIRPGSLPFRPVQIKMNRRRNCGRGLGLDDTGDMAKVFGGGKDFYKNPSRPPAGTRSGGGGAMLAGNNALGIGMLPAIAGPNNNVDNKSADKNPRAPENRSDRIIDLDKVDRAMDLLVGHDRFPEVEAVKPQNPATANTGQAGPVSVRALEQRLGSLRQRTRQRGRRERADAVYDEKMAQTEDRMMAEVQRRVELELEVRPRRRLLA